ncbi:hypothetical protein GCM10010446_31230 [Streptomyces enissocaesilis]|uniref:PPC domain-containing protein n=2 Tax=Streptomyces enissocaesilis TaxID=332589 RepID=A0ABP6JT20_9ACTN
MSTLAGTDFCLLEEEVIHLDWLRGRSERPRSSDPALGVAHSRAARRVRRHRGFRPPVVDRLARATARAAGRPVNTIFLMSKPDELLVDVAALVESGQSNQMSLTVVTGGAVVTGRLAPEAVWRQRVSDVLTDSDLLGGFSAVFDTPAEKDGPPTHLHFHVARILQGTVGIPETGGMYRVAIEDVSAWTVGDFSYSDR